MQVWYGHSVCMVAQNIVCAWSSARYILQKADDTSQCQTPDAVLRARAARAFKTIPNASSEASQVSGVWSRAPSESVAVYRVRLYAILFLIVIYQFTFFRHQYIR